MENIVDSPHYPPFDNASLSTRIVDLHSCPFMGSLVSVDPKCRMNRTSCASTEQLISSPMQMWNQWSDSTPNSSTDNLHWPMRLPHSGIRTGIISFSGPAEISPHSYGLTVSHLQRQHTKHYSMTEESISEYWNHRWEPIKRQVEVVWSFSPPHLHTKCNSKLSRCQWEQKN